METMHAVSADSKMTMVEPTTLTVRSATGETLAPWAIEWIIDGFITGMLPVAGAPDDEPDVVPYEVALPDSEEIFSTLRLLYTEKPFWDDMPVWGSSSALEDHLFDRAGGPAAVTAQAIVKLVRLLGAICSPDDLRAAVGKWARHQPGHR
jgi:hypothetical protein